MPLSRDSGVLDDPTDQHADPGDGAGDEGRRGTGIRRLSVWALLGVSALAFWAIGCLPWIVDGLQLPPSQAWGQEPSQAAVRSAHKVALPISEYALSTLLVLTVLGGCAAVLVARFAAPWVRWPRAMAALGGLLGAAACALQSRAVAHSLLVESEGASALLGSLLGFAMVGAVIGVVVGLAVTGSRPWPRVLCLAVVAALLPVWLNDLVVRGATMPTGPLAKVIEYSVWVGAVLVGVSLAFFGVQPASRLFGWLIALLITWMIPAALTALVQVGIYVRTAGTGDVLLDSLGAVKDVFVAMLSPEHHRFGPLVLAQTLGILGAAITLTRLRRSGGDA